MERPVRRKICNGGKHRGPRLTGNAGAEKRTNTKGYVEQGWFAVVRRGWPQRDVRLGRDQRGWLAVGSVGQRPRGDCRREQAAAHLVCHLLGPVGAVLGLSCNRLGVSVKGPSGAISGFPWDCSVFSQAL